MNRYTQRSALTELIDQPDIAFQDWAVCLHELDRINTLLGGHAITISGVKQLVSGHQERISIAEIGCGGGDNLNAIHKWNKGKIPFSYIGIDLNKACTEFATSNCSHLPEVSFIQNDYRLVDFGQSRPDIIFSSLFCHHFSDHQLVEMLKWMKKNSRLGFFINDLQRHPLAYHSIGWLTSAFSSSYLVKNDAPISVLRGFKRREWETLLQQAGISNYRISWRWAFRYLITVSP